MRTPRVGPDNMCIRTPVCVYRSLRAARPQGFRTRTLPFTVKKGGSLAWAADNATLFYTVDDAAKRLAEEPSAKLAKMIVDWAEDDDLLDTGPKYSDEDIVVSSNLLIYY